MGSTSLTTDSSGVKVSEVRYLPYGQERWTNEVASPADFGFTSQRAEKGFGLYDYNARYYSPYLNRFISPDSIVPEPASSGGFNRYRYTRNNPLKYTDPSGHCIPGLCPGQNVDQLASVYEAARGVERYEAAVVLNAALASTPDREPWNTGSLRTGVANDAHNIAMKEGIYGDDPAYWDILLEDAAAAGISVGANTAGSNDNYVPSGGKDVLNAIQNFADDTNSYVDLTTPQRRKHILDGDATGGGHRAGTGKPGKSEFPVDWSDDKIIHEISDVATDPASITSPGRGGRTIVEGTRDGIDIRVVLENPAKADEIITGFPTNVPRNPR